MNKLPQKTKKLNALRLIALAAFLALTGCITAPGLVRREVQSELLFRFVRFDDGTFGYDHNAPVRYNLFTDELVRIPDRFVPSKRQFRGTWVATVHNLDIPVAASVSEFKSEFNAILDTMQEWNMNALIFQVRPALDAFYPSAINPWSQFLSGRQGAFPVWETEVPGWDPLEWMVAETHKRGMEFHAWFNPFRVTAANYRWISLPGFSSSEIVAMETTELIRALNSGGLLADNNFAVLNPHYVYRFNGRLYLDPGIPAVRRHVVESIREVIENYDIDAVHFDDYFYPYPAGQLVFGEIGEDRATFERYGLESFPDTREGIEAWRRENITSLIVDVRRAINEENQKSGRAIQFGISPFGIWEHRQNDPRGSNTPLGSLRTFSGSVFSDTRLWVREELIDYIIPQIYWSFDLGAAPYAELVRWWAEVVQGVNVNLYIGHANYRHLDSAPALAAWMNPAEIINQLRYNQQHEQVKGAAFFRFRRLLPVEETQPQHEVANRAIELLKSHFQAHKTIVPPKPWLQSTAPEPVTNLVRRGNTITWNDTPDNNSRYFVVYRIPANLTRRGRLDMAIADPTRIIARIWSGGQTEFSFESDTEASRARRYEYVVTAFNAAHVQSLPQIARRY